MAALKICRKHRPRRHQPYDLPTWGQIKTLYRYALMACETWTRAGLNIKNHTSQTWPGLLMQPCFIISHKMDGEKTDHINLWLHPYTPSLEPSHPGEKGELINISLGYEVLPLCIGPTKLCVNISQQMCFRPASKRRLSDIAALSLSVNHVYTTEILGKALGKEQRTLCTGFTYKNFTYTPVHWEKCQAKSGKLMFLTNHTIVDWGPHGMWLSNCSDDINSIACDCVTQSY